MTTVHSIADPCDPEVSPTNNRHLTVSYATRHPHPRPHHEGTVAGSRRFRHRHRGGCEGDERLYCANGKTTAAGRLYAASVFSSGR